MGALLCKRRASGGAPSAAVSRFLALGFAAFALAACVAAPDAPAPRTGDLQLERAFVFMRHGVRPPTRAQVLPPGYQSETWPVWEVEPGHLTANGYRGAVHVGAFTRQALAARGLFAAAGCPEDGAIYVRTNTIHRTRETGRAFLEGFAPDCGLAIDYAEGERDDPLFDAIDLGRAPFDPAAARAAIEARAGGSLDRAAAPLRLVFDRLNAILSCCAPPVCAEAGLAAGCRFGDLPHHWEDTPPDRRVRFIGPLSLGGTAAQSLLLEYLDGKPLDAVGWGRASAADLELLSEIHAAEFDLLSRTPYIARRASAFILDMAMAALEADEAPALTLLVGHDTNIANIGGALDLHWRVPGLAADDQAVTGAIGFELLRDERGGRFVRAFYQAPSVEQVRALSPLTAQSPPYFAYLNQPLCAPPDNPTLCTLDDFLRTTDAVLVRE